MTILRHLPILLPLHLIFSCRCSAQPYRFADHVQSSETSLADAPPPIAEGCTADQQRDTDSIIAQVWNSNDGFDGNEGKEFTYGEVTNLGVRQLAYAMGVTTETEAQSIVFYDLGSGVGRLVFQMKMDNQASIQRAVGVELSKERHDIAVSAHSRIKRTFPSMDISGIDYINEDALSQDISDASHIFISSLCFPRLVLEMLEEIILAADRLEVVAALNRLDKLEALAGEQWEVSNVLIQMTWGAGKAKVYRRKRSAAEEYSFSLR